jgi:hypothetical protein
MERTDDNSPASLAELDPALSRDVWRVVIVLIVAAAGIAAYFQLFSSFAPYDDEGYVLQSLRSVLAGAPLYDATYSQYGPGYYLVQTSLHRMLDLPATHDIARWKTLAIWLLTAGCAAWGIARLTASHLLALLAFCATWLQLDRLGLEPGHPQDLVTPLVAAAFLLSTFIPRATLRGRKLLFTGLGVATGLMAATKINCGVLLAWSIITAIVWLLPAGRWTGYLRAALVFGAAALPLALARRHALEWDGALLPGAVFVGWCGVARWLRLRGDVPACRPRDLFTVIAAALVTFAGCGVWALAQGTSLSGLWYGLIEQHRQMPDVAYHHAPLPMWSPVIAVLGLVCAFRARSSATLENTLQGLLVGVLGFVALRTFGETSVPVLHGLEDRAGVGVLLACVIPFAWLGLVPAAGNANPSTALPRVLLVVSALLLPLMTYPTPGTQIAIGSLPVLWLLVLIAHDLWVALRQTQSEQASLARVDGNKSSTTTGRATSESLSTSACRLGLRGIVVLTCVTACLRLTTNWSHWAACESLDLPGAIQLRLPPEAVASRRAVTHYLRTHGDTFIATPTGCCSFYLWTEIEPPTTYNTTYWTVLLTHEQQQEVIARLKSADRPLVLVDHAQAPVKHTTSLLHQYLAAEFVTQWRQGRYEIQSRREAVNADR